MKKLIFILTFLSILVCSCTKKIVYENKEKKSTIYISYDKNNITELSEEYEIEIYNNIENKEDILKSLSFFITSLKIESNIKEEKYFTIIQLKEIYDIENNKHYLSPTLKSLYNKKNLKEIIKILDTEGYKLKE